MQRKKRKKNCQLAQLKSLEAIVTSENFLQIIRIVSFYLTTSGIYSQFPFSLYHLLLCYINPPFVHTTFSLFYLYYCSFVFSSLISSFGICASRIAIMCYVLHKGTPSCCCRSRLREFR